MGSHTYDVIVIQTRTEVPQEPERIESGPGVIDGDVQDFLTAEKAYIRVVSKGRVVYRHPTAGRSYGKGQTRWETERDKNNKLRDGNPYGIWKSKDEWEAAKWMATTKVSQSSINELLKTERVSSSRAIGQHLLTCEKYRQAKYSFKTAKSLFKKIRTEMEGFGGPEWNAETITLSNAPQDKVTLLYRDLQECADFQFGRPQFAGSMVFGPEIHYDMDETNRLYHNPWTAEDWNRRQVGVL